MNESTLNAVLNVVRIVLALLGTGLMIFVAGKWDKELNNVEAINGSLDLTFNLVYGIIIISAVVILGFGLYSLATRIKDNLGMLAGIVGFGVVILIAWATADVETPQVLRAAYGLTADEAGVSKYAGAGVNTVFYLIILAAIAVVVSEVTKIFK
jgi:hypothetical protein